MRHKDVIEKYTRHKGLWTDENSLFAVGEQAAYEWQLDFQAMKWALERIINFLEVAKKHDYFTGTLQIAKYELLNRIASASCPSNLKDEYKTINNCPLKDKCKCLQGVSTNGS